MSHSIVRLAALAAVVLATACSSQPDGATGSSSDALVVATGVDYSWARPSPTGLKSGGYTFACRYLSYDTTGKNLSASEATSLWAAGVDVVANWENSGTAALGGYSQGVSDAKAADSQANSDGIPSGRPIYFSIDFDAQSGDFAAVEGYFDGVASVIGLARTGAYGGYTPIKDLFDKGKITFGWQTYAWSYGMWDSRAQLRQTLNGITAAGDTNCCDEDQAVMADYGQWHHSNPEYAAQFVSQSFPYASTTMTMAAGDVIPSYIELKNVGSKTWDSNTKLGTTMPRDRASAFADGTWLAPNRAAAVTGTVAPGQTYKFTFDLAPTVAGSYDEHFGVVQEGVAWFSDTGQGGPPDNQLEVKIDVTPGDGGAAHPDAGAPHDGGVVPHGDGGDAGSNYPPSSGGCNMAPTERDTAWSTFVLIGLALLSQRRRT